MPEEQAPPAIVRRKPMSERVRPASVLAGILAVAVYGYLGYRAYRALVPEIQVSLSAEYEPWSRWLTVRGGAYSDSEPIAEGRALVIFETADPNAVQSFHVPVKDGKFSLDAGIAASWDQPGAVRRVTATVSAPGYSGVGYGKVMGPNESDELILPMIVITWLVMLCLFVWLFTGEYSHRKQRRAIVYAYAVAALYLILPLAVPAIVSVVPGVASLLARAPVGFLQVNKATMTMTGDSASQITIGQWSLNIGGTPSPSVAVTPPASPSVPTLAPAPAPGVPQTEDGGPPSLAPSDTPTEPAPAVAGVEPVETSISAATAPDAALASGPLPTIPHKTELSSIYDVKGGLVVPLYVLILATIGGVFRMTRSVPELEREIRGVELRRLQSVRSASLSVKDIVAVPVRAAIMPFVGLRPGPASDDADDSQPSAAVHITSAETRVDTIEVDTPSSIQPPMALPPSDDKSPGPTKRRNFDEELADARKQLTHQVLFLFTSPFMGILAYYTLVLVHDDFGSKTPIVAIVAFVSGIKSEDVLQRIVDLAHAAQGPRTVTETPAPADATAASKTSLARAE